MLIAFYQRKEGDNHEVSISYSNNSNNSGNPVILRDIEN